MRDPRPDEFVAFDRLLRENAPEGFVPWYFRCKQGGKAPDISFGSWKSERARLSTDEAVEWMENGGNVGIAGTAEDRLVNVDIDDEDETDPDDLKETLIARSRSRVGTHAWYFRDEGEEIPNIPTDDAGEVRTAWQFVVAPGSYVETDPETVPAEQRDHAGYYTVERAEPAARLSFDELPAVFREIHTRNEELRAGADTNQRITDFDASESSDGHSALFDLEARDVVVKEGGTTKTGERWSSLFHGSDTDANMALTKKGLLQCFRHNVTHNGLQALVVLSDYIASGDTACERVGAPHDNSGGSPSCIIGDDEAIWCAWQYAKESGYIPDDDPVPYRALLHLCREMGLAASDDLPESGEYGSENGKRIPDYAYNSALLAVEHKHGLQPGREQVTGGPNPDEVVAAEFGDDTDDDTTRDDSGGGSDNGNDNDSGDDDDDGQESGWKAVLYGYADSETSKRAARDHAVRQLRNENHFATFRDSGELYAYDPESGIYRPDGATVVREAVEKNLGSFYSVNEANEIVHRVKSGSYRDREEFGADADDPKVCVANGVVSLPDGEFSEHSPDHLFLTHIPVEYDPDAECPNFDSFLSDVLNDDIEQQVAYEVFGYCLFPAYPFAKALFMYGDGRNGKSTLLDVLKRFLGRENISSRGLIELSADDFAAADLYGVYANVCGDLPDKAVEHTGTFKKLTGGDLVTANPKYKQPFSFENHAKLVFSANDPPQIGDDTTAMYRRLLLLNFPNEFTPPGDPGPDARKKGELMADIASDKELSGVLNRALDALADVFERHAFSQDETVEQVRERYKKVSDPMFAFANECVKEDADGEIEKQRLYDVYREWSRENGAPVKAKNVFSTELYKRTKASDAQVRRNGKRVRVYQGVSLTGRGEEFDATGIDDDSGQGRL